jgi:hypothetical protein
MTSQFPSRQVGQFGPDARGPDPIEGNAVIGGWPIPGVGVGPAVRAGIPRRSTLQAEPSRGRTCRRSASVGSAVGADDARDDPLAVRRHGHFLVWQGRCDRASVLPDRTTRASLARRLVDQRTFGGGVLAADGRVSRTARARSRRLPISPAGGGRGLGHRLPPQRGARGDVPRRAECRRSTRSRPSGQRRIPLLLGARRPEGHAPATRQRGARGAHSALDFRDRLGHPPAARRGTGLRAAPAEIVAVRPAHPGSDAAAVVTLPRRRGCV